MATFFCVWAVYKMNTLYIIDYRLLINTVPFTITCQSLYAIYELLFWVFVNENEELVSDSYVKRYCMTHRSADV